MSSITIIASIVILLVALVCYAFFSQTVQHKSQQKTRAIQAMQARARNFRYILTGIPPDFLTKDLTLLVQNSLIDVLESLTKLEPKVDTYKAELATLVQQKNALQNQADTSANGTIDNPQQIKEVKACLEELYKFIFHLEEKRTFTREQADNYRARVKQLVLQLTIDSYVIHGRGAKDKGKLQLAMHHFQLALNLMLKERKQGNFEGRIAQLEAVIEDLQAQLKEQNEEEAPQIKENSGDDANEEWADFGKENADWKKKQIYD